VSDAINFAFSHNARDVRGHGPTSNACTVTLFSSPQDHLDDFDAEIGTGLREAAPDFSKPRGSA